MSAFPPKVSEMSTAELAHEVVRLRRLVGPLEPSYIERIDELAQASGAVRRAEEANGELRGQIAQMERNVGRLLESQGRIHRLVIHRLRNTGRVFATTLHRLRRGSDA